MRWGPSCDAAAGRVDGPRQKLQALLASKLATARAWDLKETFRYYWHYESPIWAGAFLDYWCYPAMRSRLEPMKKVARMLRAHEPLILVWFRAKGEISTGAVEGLNKINNKIRVMTRRAYGFAPFRAMEIALYHTLGRLPEPESPHRFCLMRRHNNIDCTLTGKIFLVPCIKPSVILQVKDAYSASDAMVREAQTAL
jgi:hypothetical protein